MKTYFLLFIFILYSWSVREEGMGEKEEGVQQRTTGRI